MTKINDMRSFDQDRAYGYIDSVAILLEIRNLSVTVLDIVLTKINTDIIYNNIYYVTVRYENANGDRYSVTYFRDWNEDELHSVNNYKLDDDIIYILWYAIKFELTKYEYEIEYDTYQLKW